MRDWIAVIMAVLGVLLVLAGGTLLVLNALAVSSKPNTPTIDEPTAEVAVPPPAKLPVTTRLTEAARRLPAADRLIVWGVVLLVLAAIAAGAISFNFTLAANSAK
jgi:hypothetical protein